MLKYVLLAILVGSACAGDLTVDQELYIVTGVLGGVCLLLTFVSIYNTVTIMSLQSKLRVLKAKAIPAIGGMPLQPEEFSRRDQPDLHGSPFEMEELPRSRSARDPYSVASPVRDPYSGAPPVRDDHSRRPPRDSYRQERPAPPPRPHRNEARNTSAYY